jgi:dTMP kinase
MPLPGRFITFEGPEGSGKSTQIRLLADRLARGGTKVIITREPGGTATGEAIRNMLQHDAAGEALDGRCELLLFTASRAQLMGHVILPALERGEWVLCDRFIDSTLAYQGFARGMPIDVLDQINTFAIGGRLPDLTLFLDLEIEQGFKRLELRYGGSVDSADRFELEGRAFHERVLDGYHQLVAREPERFCVVDASGEINDVAEQIWHSVTGKLMG